MAGSAVRPGAVVEDLHVVEDGYQPPVRFPAWLRSVRAPLSGAGSATAARRALRPIAVRPAGVRPDELPVTIAVSRPPLPSNCPLTQRRRPTDLGTLGTFG